ncbi:type VI secretion system membrane subunit TssM [Candidatus Curculioniphilus buchneri]|uniref:type VI secretion system membrane subunit TssM n=1 Tax=Candidatus Curculioniphilus buchneri TaxID=690594 RepID=UPI00376F0B9D
MVRPTASIKNRWFVETIFLIGIGLIVMLFGPFITINDISPFVDINVRYQITIFLFVLWLILRFISYILSLRWQKKLFQRLSNTNSISASSLKIDAHLLPNAFKHTVRFLYHLYLTKGNSLCRCLKKFNRQYIYYLPWFLVLGSKSCGKHEMLQNSDLEFYPCQEINRLSPKDQLSNYCNWYLTSNGIFLSPSSTYLQNGNSYWQQLMHLLNKYRSYQPINGVILVISTQDLLYTSQKAQYQQAILIHNRLEDLRRECRINFPIYFIFTKIDCLPGFCQYFNQFDDVQLEQYWGISLPWPADQGGIIPLKKSISDGLNQLQSRLHFALTDTLATEQDPRHRSQILAFPQAFSAIRPQLIQNLSIICSSSDEKIFSPRGIFFTSAYQQSNEQHTVSIHENNIFHYNYQPSSPNDSDQHGKDIPSPKSYFLKSLFKKIIFKEGYLASCNHLMTYHFWIISITGCMLILFIFIITIGGSIRSYRHNMHYLSSVQQNIVQLARHSMNLNVSCTTDLLHFLNQLKKLTHPGTFNPMHPSLNYRMGLYCGKKIAISGNKLYLHALKRLVWPLIAQHITRLLYQSNFDDVEHTYQALMAYQMIYQSDNYDKNFLLTWLQDSMASISGITELDTVQCKQFYQHLHYLLSSGPLISPYEKDYFLAKNAQFAMQKISLPIRSYFYLKRRLLYDNRFPTVSLSKLAGSQGEWIFERKSGLANNSPIAGFYTPDGYWQGVNTQITAQIDELSSQDKWVLNHIVTENHFALADQIRLLYMNDFIKQWERFLSDIRIKKSADLHQKMSFIRILSSESSPLRELLYNISKILSLSLSQNKEAPCIIDTVSNKTRLILEKIFTFAQLKHVNSAPEHMVRNHFRDIINLAYISQRNKEKDGASFNNILKQLNSLYYYLVALDNNKKFFSEQDRILLRLRADALRLPAPFQQLILSLINDTRKDEHAQNMQRLYEKFEFRIASFYYSAFKGRYPFVSTSPLEISLNDFAHMFAPVTGLSDRFYNQYLADKINTCEPVWRFMPWIKTANTPEEKRLLKFFQAATYIQGAFFHQGNQNPSFSFTVKPLSMDNDILSLEMNIDEQLISYHHGPSTVFQLNWPGLAHAFQVQIKIVSSDGKVKILCTEGPWAWHRMLEHTNTHWSSHNQISKKTSFVLDNYKATLEIISHSICDPFILPHLDDIMK